MIGVGYLPLFGAALLVWVPWRVVLWRRGGGDRARESVVTLLFAWAVAVAALTLFPMWIILYDWEVHANLVPFVETLRMWDGATLRTSLENIFGNLVMFAPFGVLMPLLFVKSRRPGPLASQAFVVSALIEAVQLLSRSRIFDIDDLILNTVGAIVGLGLYAIGVRLFGRGTRARAWRARVEVDGGRPPLRRAALPLALTVAIVLPFVVIPVFTETLAIGTGPGTVTADAVASSRGGRVVARAEWDGRLYLLTATGTGADEVVSLHDYIQVWPGRYSRGSESQLPSAGGDAWGWTTSPRKAGAVDPTRIMVFGANHAAKAVRLELVTKDGARELRFSGAEHFLSTFTYDDAADAADDGVINGFKLRFFDAAGRQVTGAFRSE